MFGYTTTASRGDSPELHKMLDGAGKALEWLQPAFVMADRGYDSKANHRAVFDRGGILIAQACKKA